jgi:hypothetical protein
MTVWDTTKRYFGVDMSDKDTILLCDGDWKPVSEVPAPVTGKQHLIVIDGVAWNHVASDSSGKWMYVRAGK